MTVSQLLVLGSVTGQVTSWIGHHGVYAVFLVMAIDAVLPAGGELAMLYAGALAGGAIPGAHPVMFGTQLHTGLESYLVLVAAGTLGYTTGSLVGWAVGAWGGRPLLERHGRWLHVSPQNFARAERWFDRFGAAAIFLGRLTPIVRSFVSIPAGALGSPLGLYTLLTFAAAALWCVAFAGVGWALGSSYDSVDHAFRYVDVAVGVAVLGLVAAAVLHRRRARA